VVSIFEFFNGLDGERRFAREPMSGGAFRDLICTVHPFVTMVLQRGYPVPEITYPFDREGARFDRDSGVPWILGTTLPELSDDPDALYAEVRAFLEAQPARPPARQAERLFDHWAERRGSGTVWVERSGAAIDYLGELNEQFAQARFLHIHRAGEEAALSMREHHAFRLAIMLVHQLPAGTGGSAEALGALGEDADEISRLLASRPPAEYFGRWWTDQVLRGFRALPELDADQLSPAGGWRREAAALVRGAPPGRLDALPPAEREALVAACRPGNLLLGRVR
jgi:hypothetical protein